MFRGIAVKLYKGSPTAGGLRCQGFAIFHPDPEPEAMKLESLRCAIYSDNIDCRSIPLREVSNYIVSGSDVAQDYSSERKLRFEGCLSSY